jgi:hypothetical protein
MEDTSTIVVSFMQEKPVLAAKLRNTTCDLFLLISGWLVDLMCSLFSAFFENSSFLILLSSLSQLIHYYSAGKTKNPLVIVEGVITTTY